MNIRKILLSLTLISAVSTSVFAHPGRTDANGGHTVNAEGWGYEIGTYHLHDKHDNIVPVDKETLLPAQITVVVNGAQIEFDQPPVIINSRTMIPVRRVVVELGCSVVWEEKTQTVYINSEDTPLEKTAVFTGKINVFVNNEEIVFTDQKPEIIGGRTLIPIRFVVEKLNCKTNWDEVLQIVYIESNL